jgi:hypothetical protein
MRSTKASNAIERLKKRTENPMYSMTMASNGLFTLVLKDGLGDSQRLSAPMPMDEFVTFVNAFGPQTPKRVSQLDVAFSKQLVKKAKG